MLSKHPLLFQIGTLALVFCAILNAQIGMHSKLPPPRNHPSAYCANCVRDLSGRLSQNPAPVRAFRSKHPCPATGSVHGACPGYVVDIKPGRMRWETVAETMKELPK